MLDHESDSNGDSESFDESDIAEASIPYADEATCDVTDDSGSLSIKLSDNTDVQIPERIGDYVVRQLIGSGGMGYVYLAEHTRMARQVAIKILPAERMKHDGAVDQFYEEVRAASRLLHPNIVTAFDAGEFDGIHYMVMEHVKGMTLTEIVAAQGPLSVGEAAAVIRQAAIGLLHAHRAGIVHRDVKPANLMRSEDGTIKVLDLGLAQMGSANLVRDKDAHSDNSSKGKLAGTLSYMSPEQLEDASNVDARTDIYSLGATLYFLLMASPPHKGGFLEQVEWIRKGKIPDLMHARGDVDFQFANVYSRMMAKSMHERYASLDEVIDDLGKYASQTATPIWLADFKQDLSGAEGSTVSSDSTSQVASQVFAVDFGMLYSACAEADPSGKTRTLAAGGNQETLFQMAVATDEGKLVLGQHAMTRRSSRRVNLVHCLPMYIGKQVIEREIAGRECPPEVLMAMTLRQIKKNAWREPGSPKATAITVPASYDQLHRQSILLAARMARYGSVRLVDRSIAAIQSIMIDADGSTMDDLSGDSAALADRTTLFVGVTGQATETSLVRRDGSRFQQLATGGHWHGGTLPWQHQLVLLSAEQFAKQHGIDPRRKSRYAARLQIACEAAMKSMVMTPKATIQIKVKRRPLSVVVPRNEWLEACKPRVAQIRKSIQVCFRQADVRSESVDACVLHGPLLSIPDVRRSILRGLRSEVPIHVVDQTDVARGAAASLAAELPGRNAIAMPPSMVTSQTIGVVMRDSKGEPRILPIIPKGTSLPARTNRRLTVGQEHDIMNVTLAESAGINSDEWQALGEYNIDVGETGQRTRMIGFEINVNGILSVRAQTPGAPASTKLPSLPPQVLSEHEVVAWTEWLDSLW